MWFKDILIKIYHNGLLWWHIIFRIGSVRSWNFKYFSIFSHWDWLTLSQFLENIDGFFINIHQKNIHVFGRRYMSLFQCTISKKSIASILISTRKIIQPRNCLPLLSMCMKINNSSLRKLFLLGKNHRQILFWHKPLK